MSPAELKILATARFGPTGWVFNLAVATGISEHVLRRMYRAECEITDRVAVLIRGACRRAKVSTADAVVLLVEGEA